MTVVRLGQNASGLLLAGALKNNPALVENFNIGFGRLSTNLAKSFPSLDGGFPGGV